MQRNPLTSVIVPSTHTVERSRYEWADVMLLPVNPTVLRIARPIEQALAELGISCGYLWSTLPGEEQRHWGDASASIKWNEMILPVSWYADTPKYTIQMFQGLRRISQQDLRGKFGVFATFIDGGWSPRLLTLACMRLGIPNVLIQEGMALQYTKEQPKRSLRSSAGNVVRWLRTLAAPHLFRYVDDGLHMQYACVYGQLKAESLITQGKPREKIFVTGNPLFDSVTQRPIDAHPRSRTILYAHQNLGEDWQVEVVWWRALVKTCRDLGAQLLFKLHPRSGLSVDNIRRMLDISDESSVRFVSDGDIQDMVSEAGIFVTACSSSAYRAMVEGVPIIVLEGVSSRYRIDLSDYKAVLPVQTLSELPQALHLALDDPQVRLELQKGVDVAIERHLYRLDGQASRRVACALASLLPEANSLPRGSDTWNLNHI